MYNNTSLDTLCAALCKIADVNAPGTANSPEETLTEYAANIFGGEKADRIFMYNPDAVAQWIYEKYPHLMKEATDRTELKVPFRTVMPSVTPVCFGTMYTGAQPAVHGIQKYEKPVIKIETIFDMFIKAGKKPVIIADKNCSIANIFLERDMDYFRYDNYEQVNAKAQSLSLRTSTIFMSYITETTILLCTSTAPKVQKHFPSFVQIPAPSVCLMSL